MMADDALPIGVAEEAPAPERFEKLIADYAIARSRREQIEEEKKRASQAEAIAEAKLFDALEGAGLRSVRSKELGLFTLSDVAWAAVTDPVAARAWVDANMPEVLSMNATKLAVVVREAARGEREMPPGLDAKYTRRIGWRRG